MDVLLLGFEARYMLDGIKRRLKKTTSFLSLYPSVTFYLSLHPEQLGWVRGKWQKKKIKRLMESMRWMEGFLEKHRLV